MLRTKLQRARDFRRNEIIGWLRDASALLLEIQTTTDDPDLGERADLCRMHVDEARTYVEDPDEFEDQWRAMIERGY